MFPMNLGPGELLVVMLFAVLLFGKRLPEVGRSLGKGIVEFKKGLRGMEDDESGAVSSSNVPAQRVEPTAAPAADYAVPKFEPPTTPPAAPAEG